MTTTISATNLLEGMKIVNVNRPDVVINVTHDAIPDYYYDGMVTVGTDMGILYFPTKYEVTIEEGFKPPKRNVSVPMNIVREVSAQKSFIIDATHFKDETGKDITDADGREIWNYLVEHEHEQVWDIDYQENDITPNLESVSPISPY